MVRADNATIINGGPQATYDAWVYPAAVPPVDNYVAILSVGDATLPTFTTMQCRLLYWRTADSPAGSARFYVDCGLNDNTDSYFSRMSAQNYPIDNWHFVAATFNNGALDLFVNGVLDNGVTAGPGGTFINTGSYKYVSIGALARNDGSVITVPLTGRVDEPEIYDRALTAADVLAIYNAGSAGKCKPASTPTLNINDVTQAEGNAGTTNFDFTISLSAPAGADGVTFDIATADGTATSASGDYIFKSLTAQTIPSGGTTYTFTVQVNGDTNVEPDETFFVNVTNVAGATAGDTQGQSTIQNEDLQSDLAISMTDSPDPVIEGNALTYIINVTNNGPSNATNINITDTLPTSVTFVSASSGCTHPEATILVLCSIPNLSSSNTAYVQITVAPDHSAAGASISNTATARAAEPDPNSPNTATQITEVLAATCVTPPTSMIGWWPGQGNANDVSGHGNNGTRQNGDTYATGKVGQAFNFDGVDDYVAIPNLVNSWPEGTLDTWVNFKDPTPKDSGDYVFSSGGTILGIHKAAGNDFVFGIYDSVLGWQWAHSGIVPNAGQWYHLGATWGPAGINIYVDGVWMGTDPYTGPSYNSIYNSIGAAADINGSTVNAYVDEFEIFNRALSQTEIQSIYNASSAGKCQLTCTPPPSGMVSWWSAENNANDIISTNNGALQNHTTFAAGEVGQAFSFDGVDDYVEVPHSDSLNLTSGLTLDTWFKVRSAGYATLFSKSDANGSASVSSYNLQINPDGAIQVTLYGTYPEDNWTTAAGLVTTGQWYHVALTWDGSYGPSDNVKLYLNGALVQAWTKSGAPLNVTTETLTLGSMKLPTYYGHMDGLIDEPEIFNRALSQTEIQAVYDAGYAGKCRRAPTDITLSNSNVPESQPAGTVVGSFSTTDPDVGDTHTYSLVPGTGDTDNASFEIVGDQLKTAAVFDYETKPSYSIRVRSTDPGGLTFERAFTIDVTNANEAPTEIALDNSNVAENQASGTLVGTFSTTDPNAGDTFTYSLVTGPGDTDNASFTIAGNQLQTNAVFDFETKSTYSIRVSSTDQGGLSFEMQFMINVVNVNEFPTISDIADQSTMANTPTAALAFTVGDVDTDVNSLTLSGNSSNPALVPNANIVFGGSGANRNVTVTPASGLTGTSTITITVSDGILAASDTFVITVNAAPAATGMVISQAYGGGGNAGSTYKNDFIELFNLSNAPIDITGWSVQYASSTGNTWQVTPLCATGTCTIAPGQYYLVKQAGGPLGTTDLPAPDATGAIPMGNTAGKVALVANTTLFSFVVCPTGATIVDFVGYGTGTNCFEGSGPTLLTSNLTAALRKNNGCLDTNNNNPDFEISAPNPRNSSSPLNNCSVTTLGNYANTSVTLSDNATITPDSAPANATTVNVSTSTKFNGKLEADPTTGVVRVTNAHPAGIYPATVTAFGAGGSTTETFTLTVTDGTACAGVSVFTNAADSSVGSHPYSVAIGDFNNDGKQDIAAANQDSDTVSIRLGDGLGGFSVTTDVSVGDMPRGVAIGDFNNDGKQDIAAANYGSDTVSIRLGDGLGGFSGATEVSVGDGPMSVAIGDFNNDGKQDFATANYWSDTVSIRLGDGSGGFTGSTEVSVGDIPYSVAIGDFDGNGNQDLAAANIGDKVSIRLGNGAGVFAGTTEVSMGPNPLTVAIGDFDGDGNQDLAAANNQTNKVPIRLGNGAGNFSGTTEVIVGFDPRSLGIGDFNNDGKQDIAAANYSSNTVSMRLGDGAGNFTGTTEVSVGTNPRSVAIGDFNNDGKQDFAAASYFSSKVSIRLGQCSPPPTFAIDDVTHNEGDAGTTSYTFTVTKTGSTTLNSAVNFTTVDGTATTTDNDYQLSTGALDFLATDTTKQITVLVNGDTTVEPDEAFTVHLTSASNATIDDADGTGTIQNDDGLAVSVSVHNAAVAEPTSGTTNMLFTVSLNAPAPPGGASVNFTTADEPAGPGKAVAGTCGNPGADYVLTSGTVSFTVGQQVRTISVPVCADGTVEPDETFLVNLSGAVNATIGNGTASGTIQSTNPADAVLISELRTSGPGGAGDDFVEIYNNSNSPLTVAASDASGGYGLYKMGADCNATPILIGVIPNGTVIPARGHYLFVGSAYSLANYGGTGAAAGNLTFSADIETDANVGLFSTSNLAGISSVNRLDAVGFGVNVGGACDLLREGSTLPPIAGNATIEHSYFRKMCEWIQGSGCTVPGIPKDTNNNADDFWLADTNGSAITGRLGAPGPENLGSPIRRDNTVVNMVVLDGTTSGSGGPNRDRNSTAVPNGTFGTMTLRYRVTNNTGAPVTRLRYRIVDISTAIQPPGPNADLRALTSSVEPSVGPVNDPVTCTAGGAGAPPCNVTVTATTLETPPAQAIGGGYNSTLSSGTVTTETPLPNGQSILINFRLGVQKTGLFRFYIIIEALP
ncbi:MAG: LamG-like jellyroll fold domain-containing protein [Pyrinomonadaceae bacterium]